MRQNIVCAKCPYLSKQFGVDDDVDDASNGSGVLQNFLPSALHKTANNYVPSSPSSAAQKCFMYAKLFDIPKNLCVYSQVTSFNIQNTLKRYFPLLVPPKHVKTVHASNTCIRELDTQAARQRGVNNRRTNIIVVPYLKHTVHRQRITQYKLQKLFKYALCCT